MGCRGCGTWGACLGLAFGCEYGSSWVFVD